jgi:transcriptional regulator with XRE-family HTH domain
VAADNYRNHVQSPRLAVADQSGRYSAREFARICVARRREMGWSMRDVASRAGISQPYLVGLERPLRDPRRGGPVPSMDVFERVTRAIGLDPIETYAAVTGRHGAHVLVVTDGTDGSRALARLRRTWGAGVDDWIWFGEDGRGRSAGMRKMSLRSHVEPSYVTDRVESALRNRLRRARPSLRGRTLGMVFADSGALMARFGNPGAIADFEDGWLRVAAHASEGIGSRALVNACGYDVEHLRATPDPAGLLERLVDAHTHVWYAGARGLQTGTRAVAQLRRRVGRG